MKNHSTYPLPQVACLSIALVRSAMEQGFLASLGISIRGLDCFENLCHGGSQLAPRAFFRCELFAPSRSQLVVLGAAVVLGGAPVGLDPAASLKAMQGRIERALLNLHDVTRNLLQALGNGPAVARAESESFQNEEIESALRKLDAFRGHVDLPL